MAVEVSIKLCNDFYSRIKTYSILVIIDKSWKKCGFSEILH